MISVYERQINEQDSSEEKKRLERQRLNQLIALCEAVRCRRQILLSYFGEQSDVCGNCDICKNGIKLVEGTEDAQKVLSAIKRTGERFGVTHIVNVLIGSESENIKKFSHNSLKTFGVGKDLDKNTWQSIIRQLFSAGHINIDIENYGALKILKTGNDILFNSLEFKRRQDFLAAKAAPTKNRVSSNDIDLEDETLYEKLRDNGFSLPRNSDYQLMLFFQTKLKFKNPKPKNEDDVDIDVRLWKC